MGLFGSKNKDKAVGGNSFGEVELEDGSKLSVSAQVDCLGDSCPRPQLMTKKALGKAASTEVVEILVDNPTSMEALPPMCPAMSASHLLTRQGDRGWHVYIQKN